MKLEVFFDYACPYCLTGLEYLKKLIPAHPGIEIEWVACEAHPRPESYGIHSDIAIQGLYFALEGHHDVWRYHDRIFKAVFEEKLDIEKPRTIVDCAAEIGVDSAALKAALESGKYAGIPEKNNRRAWGENNLAAVPSYKMNGKLLKSRNGHAVSESELAAFLTANALD